LPDYNKDGKVDEKDYLQNPFNPEEDSFDKKWV
jgi:hypothetical protein